MTKFQDILLNENIDGENINDEDIDDDMSTNLQDLLLMKSKLRVCCLRWKFATFCFFLSHLYCSATYFCWFRSLAYFTAAQFPAAQDDSVMP